ncbi:hypothetical protein D3C86_2033270 [compost metagenome]
MVVDIVVPGGRAETSTDVFVLDVEFGQDIQAIRNEPAIKISVAVIQVGIAIGRTRADRDLVIEFVHAPGVAVLDRVVPGRRKIGITRVDLEGVRGR